jgi:hypothetical protein
MLPPFDRTPAPRTTVRVWHLAHAGSVVTLAVGGEMLDLHPDHARAIALTLIEAAQLVEGGPAYAAAVTRRVVKR